MSRFTAAGTFESLTGSGQIDRLRTDLLANLDRIDSDAATGLWADLAWDIDMGDFHRKTYGRRPASSAHAADRARTIMGIGLRSPLLVPRRR